MNMLQCVSIGIIHFPFMNPSDTPVQPMPDAALVNRSVAGAKLLAHLDT